MLVKANLIRNLNTILNHGASRTLSPRIVSHQSNRTLTFTPEHDELRNTVRKVVEKDIDPYFEKWEREGQYDGHHVLRALNNAGLLGITRDPEYNGLGLDYSYSVPFFEGISDQNNGGVAMSIMVHTDMALPALANFGSHELKKEFLAPSLNGEYMACVGVSEPSGGSDVANIKSYAKHDGDDLIINGSKLWITNGAQADWMCMLVNTGDGPLHKNKSLVCVPMKTPGVNVARKVNKIGLHSSDTAEIFFDNVRVPKKNIIGEENMGFIYQMIQFQDERLCCSISAVTQMERYIEMTIDWCRQRHTFDKPLIDNQYIHFRLSELMAEIELLKCLNYRAVDLMMEGENVTYLATIAKLKCGRLIREVTDSCLQFFGGMGFTEDLPIGRAYRDCRAMSIAGGADEIMLSIISGMKGIAPKQKRGKPKPKVEEQEKVQTAN